MVNVSVIGEIRLSNFVRDKDNLDRRLEEILAGKVSTLPGDLGNSCLRQVNQPRNRYLESPALLSVRSQNAGGWWVCSTRLVGLLVTHCA